MAKWHARDELNHNRPSCDRHGHLNSPLVASLEDFARRIASDQCQKCAKRRAGAIRAIRQNLTSAADYAATWTKPALADQN